MNYFTKGFKSMAPVTMGVVPFGAVMGTVCFNAHLSLFQTMSMNVLVYAGAAQLAAVELMNKHAAEAVVIATGLIINVRFLLYSAAMSPIVHSSRFLTKFVCAYWLTDQSYAIMSANHSKLKTHADAIKFYFGAATGMALIWHSSVIAGYVFGNFAPASWALDYAVPLSFVALLMPTFKNSKYIIVAAFSSVVSLVLNPLPYRSGLIVTGLLGIALATLLTQKKGTT